MSAQLAPTQDDDNVVEMNDSPGRRLRVARQARGLEIEQVAAELHLTTDRIAALEADNYDALPGNVFVLGYMRNYARLLRIDPEPLLDAYRATTGESPPARPRRSPSAPKQVGSDHLIVKLVTLAIVIAAGGLAFTWWQNQNPRLDLGEDEATAAVSQSEITPALADVDEPAAGPIKTAWDAPPQGMAPSTSPAPTRTPVEQPEPGIAMVATPEPEGAEAPIAAAESAASTDQTAEPASESAAEEGAESSPQPQEAAQEATDDAESTEPAAPAEGEIVMSFTGPCWVDVRDSERKFKLFGEMTKGDRHVLEGSPPYSVILGNTAAVNITVAGAPFDLDGIARGNVARFTLDPGELPDKLTAERP